VIMNIWTGCYDTDKDGMQYVRKNEQEVLVVLRSRMVTEIRY